MQVTYESIIMAHRARLAGLLDQSGQALAKMHEEHAKLIAIADNAHESLDRESAQALANMLMRDIKSQELARKECAQVYFHLVYETLEDLASRAPCGERWQHSAYLRASAIFHHARRTAGEVQA